MAPSTTRHAAHQTPPYTDFRWRRFFMATRQKTRPPPHRLRVADTRIMGIHRRTGKSMVAKIERIRPDFLWNKQHFTNLVTSAGGKTIHLSGLVSSTPEGELVGPSDLGAQMDYI